MCFDPLAIVIYSNDVAMVMINHDEPSNLDATSGDGGGIGGHGGGRAVQKALWPRVPRGLTLAMNRCFWSHVERDLWEGRCELFPFRRDVTCTS